MDRRSFLGSLVAGVAALLLPKRITLEEVKPVAEGHTAGRDEPCADFTVPEEESGILYTEDGALTWSGTGIPWMEADIEFAKRMHDVSVQMGRSAREYLEIFVNEILENA